MFQALPDEQLKSMKEFPGGEFQFPIHEDGSRGSLLLAFSLWTGKTLRLYTGDKEETLADSIRCHSGHCYASDFMGTRRQVVHPSGVSDAERRVSKVLGPIEVVVVFRSSAL